jgi:hypothetical protein
VNIGELCTFNFAGAKVTGTYLGEFILNDNTKIHKFKDQNGYIYPVKKENIE